MDPFAAIKQGAKAMWGLGDYRPIAEALMPDAEALLADIRVSAGADVLDVAAGTGNFAVAAARLGARAVATDYAPRMLAWGRERTAAAGVDVEWIEADAEDLPFGDDRFDVVGSAFGAMFGPRPDVVASELFRVTKPGGIVAMTNWTADGFSGRTSSVIASFAPPAPVPMPSPTEWGDAAVVRERLGPMSSSVGCERRAATFRFASPEVARRFFQENAGGNVILRSMLPADRVEAFDAAIDGLVREFARREGDCIVLENAYLRVIATKA